jgi:Asp-tRNA(Asn)/Glu-tRNA(Gln) amidotransferase A subunit family amidase
VLLAAADGGGEITSAVLADAERLIGLELTEEERQLMLGGLAELREDYAAIRSVPLANELPPAFRFDPEAAAGRIGPRAVSAPAATAAGDLAESPPRPPARPGPVELPDFGSIEELAFQPVSVLARLVETRRVRSVELTRMYLERLGRFDPVLHCVINSTAERALAQAERADREIAAGRYRGPLHGIPWGAKDLLAVGGYPTTWGATPFRDQQIAEDATVVRRLDEAGAVLVAKLTVGALAWGDVWFGGRTRNPWQPEQGSSGSSAGSAAAVAAGLVGFAIGTETYGSIVSPAFRCGATGLRPTFGRVSRQGVMALSWTLDKVGPLCRTAEDCALVLDAIAGADGLDPSAVDRPFAWVPGLDPRRLRVGYVPALFEEPLPEDSSDLAREQRRLDLAVLDVLRALGVVLIAVELPDRPVAALSLILTAEASAAFDELTRSGRDDLLVRQEENAWPNVFRQGRMIPAVEYVQANRVRTLLARDMEELFGGLDAYVTPAYGGSNLLLTNLTGHPMIALPDGFRSDGTPGSITLTGALWGEAALLSLAQAYQGATGFHRSHPDRERQSMPRQ